ncbi:cytochrome c oxidase accessory protein FixG [Tranquillimonas rosea]|uniref:Cytochrome c oxidase accessory protein FixG n=1 Tax=Tranquillimonas rosea TaxID=641238 RepID=A0A1H9Q0C8_9RHOB|nr:cytochrome c oxidase accessory protein CcoG [Tranquillimonas rosea]SER53890.1 cytochrome c oxidase accessory protein FixG [Tranquillimonas rosea]
MTTKTDSLYAPREPVFPRRVSGYFRTLKWWIMAVTLAIYYVTPWIRWDRGPALPDQAVLVDLADRRFYFFWIEIWPHEFYFVAGLLIMAGLGLFLFTAALGRVWCGYTCPQTVWTDLFILVERWIEGDRNARVRLHNAPWSVRKARLRATKWTVWMLIGLATGGAWVFYFTDAPTLAQDLLTFDAAPVAYMTIATLTATTFVFGGFMREQVCIYMCPWPRIQGAMMDEDTLTVAYRDWRGEPRGKHRKAAGAEALGDCIDCNACVNVCPMGIDIRDGQQMACITCALCIDACDDVMAKTGRDRGLIDYLALSDAPREIAGGKPKPIWQHVLRPRNVVYTALWAAVGLGLLFALFIRPEIEMTVAPVRNPTFVTLSDGTIRNAYDVRIRNKHGEAREFAISATAEAPLSVEVEGSVDGKVGVSADTQAMQRVYVSAPPESTAASAERTDLRLWVQELQSGARASVSTTFNGSGQ